ncbi:MAG TPA: DUF350 domain-containing protein [Candidatus Marinimicrobia bacterium]|nr:DUF350 domain-containing protein [Candidatus Neomarinimicrobiota bacterium]
MLDPLSFFGRLAQMGYGILWSIAASIGFAFGVGLALKVFDWLSIDIEEWQEIKNGNIGVALIFISIILVIGMLIYKVI